MDYDAFIITEAGVVTQSTPNLPNTDICASALLVEGILFMGRFGAIESLGPMITISDDGAAGVRSRMDGRGRPSLHRQNQARMA